MTSASQSLLRTLYGIKFLKITIDNASQGLQEMIRDKTILWGYEFHNLIRDKYFEVIGHSQVDQG